jgi:hypothetical protein
LSNPFERGYLRRIGLIHRPHIKGEANGSTMVVTIGDFCVGGGWNFPYYPTGQEFFVPARTLIGQAVILAPSSMDSWVSL